jgi:tRNA uridine 5-carboxymethylaminomethyl modification enzyme
VLGKTIEHEHNLFDLLRRPGVGYADLLGMDGGKYHPVARPDDEDARPVVSRETLGELHDPVVEQVEIAAKYSGYIDRQKDEVERASHHEHLKLPAELDYAQVTALSFEARQKLAKHRPETLGQAARISGITPASISLLMIHLKKGGFKGFARLTEEQGA